MMLLLQQSKTTLAFLSFFDSCNLSSIIQGTNAEMVILYFICFTAHFFSLSKPLYISLLNHIIDFSLIFQFIKFLVFYCLKYT